MAGIPLEKEGAIWMLLNWNTWICQLIFVSLMVSSIYCEGAMDRERLIPLPLSNHPGNIFLEDEVVSLSFQPSGQPCVKWRVLDDHSAVIKEGIIEGGTSIVIGKLGIGWYRIEFLDSQGVIVKETTAAVIARLRVPVPDDSPIGVDAAISWYPEKETGEREKLAILASLAGVSWIRDRLRWREMQLANDVYAASTHYDRLAAYQKSLGMNVLQVFHATPKWALKEGDGALASDLRIVYQFCKAMAQRFKGKVNAWEPWNEGNAHDFGGLTIDELCSYQKAAFLGFKAGDEHVTVSWQPIGGINVPALTGGILANETWPYYDTYNIHSYDWTDAYESLWGPAREAACGKPIWVTECDRAIKSDPNSSMGDLTMENDLLKAEFMAQSYSLSLHAGSVRHFHFILGDYMWLNETVQFGLLRRDLTPRPAYVALAALGRLLAGAKCLGRWIMDDQPDVYVIAFRSFPDGKERDVLAAWTEVKGDWHQRGHATVQWNPPSGMQEEEVFDYLGRSQGKVVPTQLTSSPVFLVLPPGETGSLKLTRPALSAKREAEPSPVVLQLIMPQKARELKREGWTDVFDRTASSTQETELTIAVYNFWNGQVNGKVSVESIPERWRITPGSWNMTLDPMGREETRLKLIPDSGKGNSTGKEWIIIRGEFGEAGRPCVAFRMKRISE